jgi:hypothetical protein
VDEKLTYNEALMGEPWALAEEMAAALPEPTPGMSAKSVPLGPAEEVTFELADIFTLVEALLTLELAMEAMTDELLVEDAMEDTMPELETGFAPFLRKG